MSECSLRNRRTSTSTHILSAYTCLYAGHLAGDILEIPLAIDVVAVFVGALGGAVRAGEDEHVDVVGVLTLATVTGFGGGMIRDVLLGDLPPAVLRNSWYIAAAVIAAAFGAFFLYYVRKLRRVLWVLDALSIGLFACVGANAALLSGLPSRSAVLIGTVASVGGPILTDLFQGGRPRSCTSARRTRPPDCAARSPTRSSTTARMRS
ncbi:trimeric intracellular cation channel family protein [Demequina sp.]|uniref:trimeric intracellular cation channel family protein n=1 Tax=Demequina sp. TaxID=2050685 RepID=UPI003D11383E